MSMPKAKDVSSAESCVLLRFFRVVSECMAGWRGGAEAGGPGPAALIRNPLRVAEWRPKAVALLQKWTPAANDEAQELCSLHEVPPEDRRPCSRFGSSCGPGDRDMEGQKPVLIRRLQTRVHAFVSHDGAFEDKRAWEAGSAVPEATYESEHWLLPERVCSFPWCLVLVQSW